MADSCGDTGKIVERIRGGTGNLALRRAAGLTHDLAPRLLQIGNPQKTLACRPDFESSSYLAFVAVPPESASFGVFAFSEPSPNNH